MQKLRQKENKINNIKVAVVACVHGDELVGKKIIRELNKLTIKNGILKTFIANPEAVKKKKRCIDTDLNRSFPGNKNGTHEEKIAYKLNKELQDFNYVIDIHSTTTDVESLVIITKLNKEIRSLINAFNSKRVALMPKNIAQKAMIYYCNAGISFEYGNDKSNDAYKNALNDIKIILSNLNLIEEKIKKPKQKTELYKVIDTLDKPKGCKVNKELKNFKEIKKGDLIGETTTKKIIAKRSFYPILFSEKAYEKIFGFRARKLKW
ncbi:succinylglutamate desuccinylase/aspartoacylase family protein [Patescibacteria group bacterium]|nr:succinylglutamate desuccinylase/aspartoacylase family protein [Patescibacteria group bacterium]